MQVQSVYGYAGFSDKKWIFYGIVVFHKKIRWILSK